MPLPVQAGLSWLQGGMENGGMTCLGQDGVGAVPWGTLYLIEVHFLIHTIATIVMDEGIL